MRGLCRQLKEKKKPFTNKEKISYLYLNHAIKILRLIFFPKLGTKNNLPSTTAMVHKYYPKLGTQNNQPNTTATVHEVKR
jgi:hypothetical protein